MILLVNVIWVSGPMRESDAVVAQSREQSPQRQRPKAVRYACPMHPEVTSAKRGKCPKCGMALRLVKDKVEAPATVTVAPDPSSDSSSFSSARIPDVQVYDQDGKRLNFYTILSKARLLQSTSSLRHTTICPPLTRLSECRIWRNFLFRCS